MGGIISFIICVLGCVALYGTGHPILFWLSVAMGLANLWTWGVMHNFAMESAKARHDLIVQNMRAEGRSEEDIQQFDSRIIRFGRADVNEVPDWLAWVDMLATAIGVVLLVTGAIIRLT